MVSTRRETLTLIAAGAVAGVGLTGPALGQAKPVRLALVVKVLGTGFSDAIHRGGTEAADELGGVDLIYAGPVKPTAEEQIQVIEPLIAQRVDAIAIAASEPSALAAVCKKAVQRGIKVVSFDRNLAKDARTVQVEPSSAALVGPKLIQMMAKTLHGEGDVAILSTTPQAADPNAWIAEMKQEWVKPEYAKVKLAATVYGDDAAEKSYRAAQDLFKAFPTLRGIIAPTSVGVAAAARAVLDAGLLGKVYVTGVGLPSEIEDAVLAGATDTFAAFNPVDLGYAAVTVADMLAAGRAAAAPGSAIKAGRLGDLTVGPDGVLAVGGPLVIDKSNLETFAKQF
jgi:rhamnose transport system substrate-binding protein